ncbi:MAG TPA: serine/threonine-protein kinase [Blastocatellia bacterium]|nr:serine/threonine-protein kinase [Blastocatellia bacterium]
MPPEKIEQIIELFDVVSEQSPEERRALLDAVCQGDPELRAEVERLIRAHDYAAGFLEQSPLLSAESFDQSALRARAVGRRIGPYRLLREIGHGGMGTVYLAVRDDDAFQKQVAIKLVWPGWNRDEMLRRFLQERRILARLEHPHIARLLDGGTTGEGWPYVVMEYVDGVPVTAYCDEQRLTIAERLRLFCRICEAVEYAHQHKIIHRDLKPANLLVTADGTVKLLDFGIARLMDPDVAPGSETQTLTGLRAMTPEYASPEQVRGEPVTIRSDVYSLGVLLYELLTGERPYQLSGYPLYEAVRIICETEPPRPSQLPPADFRLPTSALRGDLDNIVLMALRKDPAHRYSSVRELRADIERHLKGEAVLARGDSLIYRTGRLVRRHRAATANALIMSLLLAGGLLYALRQLHLAREQAREQRRARYAAQMPQSLDDWQHSNPGPMNEKLLTFVPQPGEEELRGFEWFYLWRLAHRELIALRHDDPVEAAYFMEGGRLLQTTTVRPDDQRQLRNWETANWRLVTSDPAPLNMHGPSPPDLTASPETPDRILIKDLSGRVITTLSDPGNGLSVPHWIDADRMVTGGKDNVVRIWNVRTGHLLRAMPPVAEQFDGASFPFPAQLPELMLARYGQRVLRMWDLRTGRLVFTIRGKAGIRAWNISGLLAVHDPARSGQVQFLDPATGRLKGEIRAGQNIRSADFSPRAGLLATAGDDRAIRLWNLKTWREVAVLRGHADLISRAVFSADRRVLASISNDRTLRLWDVAARRELKVIRGHEDEIYSLDFSPDDQLLVTASHDRTARVWRVSDLLTPDVLDGHTGLIFSVAISPDGSHVATGGQDGTVRLWNLQDGAMTVLRGHKAQILAVAFSPDGRTLVSGSDDSIIRWWDIASGQVLKTISNDTAHGIRSLAISPDGKWLAVPGRLEARLRDAASGELLQQYVGHDNHVLCVAFSPDGAQLLTGGMDNTARLWDRASGRLLATLRGHSDWVWSVKFSPDGKTIATGSRDRTVKLWDFTTLAERATLRGHTDEVFSVAFAPDGRRLATGSNDQTIRLWNLTTLQEVLTLRDHTDQVWSVAFSADGLTLVSGSWDGTARVWRAATETEVSHRQGR